MSAIEELRLLFESAELIAPPVPAPLEPYLRERERWAFATREIDPMAMYSFDRYLLEAVAASVDDYVAVSHAGHGANSYGLNYHLVYGPIAVFAQTGWGGAYMDAEESAAEVGRQFTQCAELIAITEASLEHLPTPPARLIVAESTFRESGVCKWLDRPLGDEQAAMEWLREAQEHEGPKLRTERAAESRAPFGAIARAIELARAAT